MDVRLHEVAQPLWRHWYQICCARRDHIPSAAEPRPAGDAGYERTDSDSDEYDFGPGASDLRTPSNWPILRQSPYSCHRLRWMSQTRTRGTCADSGLGWPMCWVFEVYKKNQIRENGNEAGGNGPSGTLRLSGEISGARSV